MARELGPKGLVILGVSVDKDPEIYKKFLEKNPLAYPTARDPEQTINTKYGTIQYPESYLIDRNGKVIEKYISVQPWNSPQMLQSMLASVRNLLRSLCRGRYFGRFLIQSSLQSCFLLQRFERFTISTN